MVRRVFARVAGVCGLLALVTATVGWVEGGLAQPGSYSPGRDDISDLGAVTANSAWIYNQVGANLTGVLVAVLAVGLWRALSPDLLGRLGAAALFVAGTGSFLDGLFRLDCRGIDAACTNDSWHSHAHKLESAITAAAILLAPLVSAFAFRRIRGGTARGCRAWPWFPRSCSRMRRSRRSETEPRREREPWSSSPGSPSSAPGWCVFPPTLTGLLRLHRGLASPQQAAQQFSVQLPCSASHAFATRFCARVSHASATRSCSSSRSRRARLGMRTSTAA